MLKNISFNLGLFLVLGLIFTAIISFIWLPHSIYDTNIDEALKAPDFINWLGTDSNGRDILSLIMAGARTSIWVGFVATFTGLIIGSILGLIAAAKKGMVEEIIMRMADFGFAFPALLTAIIFAAVYESGITSAMFAIGLYNIPAFIRISRAGASAILKREFILAAKACGQNQIAIIFRHIIPNIAPLLLAQSSLRFGIAILAEAALSYLGLGTQPPEPSWGRMLTDAQSLIFEMPSLAIYPGLAIGLSVLGLNLLGDGLQDKLNPRSK